MKKLPQRFLDDMKELLMDEYDDFIKSYDEPKTTGLRINTLKINKEELLNLNLYNLTPIPWADEGFYYDEEVDRPGKSPLHESGAYYLQEPSAMSVVPHLDIKEGDKVLDMCAAPGGKSTYILSKLNDTGLLVSNEINPTRIRALGENLERFGASNCIITNTDSNNLRKLFTGYFDKVVIDAPCSGQGMFRKDEVAITDWSYAKVLECQSIQKEIIRDGYDMLKNGGILVYSTCTFAPCEDEQIISWLLRERPELSLISMEGYEGFSTGNPEWGDGNPQLKKCVRIFPHKMQGEGHFLALLQKEGTAGPSAGTSKAGRLAADVRKYMEEFFREIGLKTLDGQKFDWNRVEVRADKVYYLPSVSCNFRGLTFIRNGLYLGDLKKNRFEPAQPLALAFRKNEAEAVISLSVDDPRLERYLKGETLTIEPEEAAHPKGWHLLCVEGYPLGFGKLVNGTLKNKYPAGWRV